MALPNPGMSFTPFDVLPASDLNDIVENIEELAAGTGLDTGAIVKSKLASSSVDSTKIDWAASTGKVWWEELGRTTLGVAGDTVTVSGLATRKYLKVLFIGLNSGALTNTFSFNNDRAGTTYTWRKDSSGAETNFTSNPFVVIDSGSFNISAVMDIVNIATQEKPYLMQSLPMNSVGAGNTPGRIFLGGKWSNTSNAISRIDFVNTGAGDYAAGTELIVLGHD